MNTNDQMDPNDQTSEYLGLSLTGMNQISAENFETLDEILAAYSPDGSGYITGYLGPEDGGEILANALQSGTLVDGGTWPD